MTTISSCTRGMVALVLNLETKQPTLHLRYLLFTVVYYHPCNGCPISVKEKGAWQCDNLNARENSRAMLLSDNLLSISRHDPLVR